MFVTVDGDVVDFHVSVVLMDECRCICSYSKSRRKLKGGGEVSRVWVVHILQMTEQCMHPRFTHAPKTQNNPQLAALLLEKETLHHDDLVATLGPAPYKHGSPYHIDK